MLKKSPSRSSRSKSIKVKHVLQIALLIGVCFWLVYQVKRSHDKKKEFDQKDNRMTVKTEDASEILKLGRKDLHPHIEEVHTSEKHEEDEEDETAGEEEELKHEGEDGQEEQKNEGEDQEADDDGKGGGDDEIDENDDEKADNESDHEGDFFNDERLKEDEGTGANEDREKEDEEENGNSTSLEEQDSESSDRNSHEAREEQYKGDDASSAVAHEAHLTTSETDETSLENSNEKLEMESREKDSRFSDTEEFKKIHNSSRLSEEVAKMPVNETSTDANIGDVKLNGNTSITTDGSVQDAILTTRSDDRQERSDNNTSSASTETNKPENSDSLQQKETEIGFNHAQNGTIEGSNAHNETSLQFSILAHSNDTNVENTTSDSQPKQEKPNGVEGESLNVTSITDPNVFANKTSESEDILPVTRENNEASQDEKSKDNDESETGNGSDSTNHTEDFVQEDPIDSSDNHVRERVDLDTLPDIRTEVDHSEEAAAE